MDALEQNEEQIRNMEAAPANEKIEEKVTRLEELLKLYRRRCRLLADLGADS